ncbi:MAG: hypothetical protein ACFFCW_02730 [Candidatus Hodarchaeota archaeon]
MSYYLDTAEHYYLRMDHRTPAQIINEYLQNGDIVISTLGRTDYYLNRLDYYYCDYREHDFSSISACSGKMERWSNAKLIFMEDALWDILENHPSTVWHSFNMGILERWRCAVDCFFWQLSAIECPRRKQPRGSPTPGRVNSHFLTSFGIRENIISRWLGKRLK